MSKKNTIQRTTFTFVSIVTLLGLLYGVQVYTKDFKK